MNSTSDLIASPDTAKNVPWKWSEKIDLKPLYNVGLVEEDGKHFYTIGNDPTFYPGVTGILDCISKPALVPWAAKATAEYTKKILLRIRGLRMPDERFYETLYKRSKKQPKFAKETAARIGSGAHKIFDSRINGRFGTNCIGPYMDAFSFYLSNEKPNIVSGDLKVASRKFGFGGSLDALAKDAHGKIIVLDWKTGKSIWPEMAAQVSAYSVATKEMFNLDYLPEAKVVRFDKEKFRYEICQVRSIEDSFNVFRSALDLYMSLQLVPFSTKTIIGNRKNHGKK